MKQLFITFLACWIGMSGTISGAENDSIVIGRTLLGGDLKAVGMLFSDPIRNVTTAPGTDIMSILLSKNSDNILTSDKTTIVAYSQTQQKVLWKTDVKGFANARPTSHGILVTVRGKTTMFGAADGKETWKGNLVPVYANDSLDIVVGYKATTGNKVQALRMATGEKLWEGKVKKQVSWGWDDVHSIGDGRILVVADDIYVINLLTGDIQSIDAKTGYEDLKTSLLMGLAAGMASVAGAAVGGYGTYYIPMSTYGPNVVNGLSSNIFGMDGRYFIADRNCLRCFSDDMQVQWQYDYPTEKSSASFLFGDYHTVYMMNFGYGLRNRTNKIKHSRPFIASFNALTGEPFFFNTLKMKKDIVEDALITPQEAYILFDDGMAYQRDINDSVVNITPWDKKRYGKLTEIIHDTIYAYRQGEQVFTPIAYDGESCPVVNDSAHVFVVSRNLQVREDYPAPNLYLPVFKTSHYMLAKTIRGASARSDSWLVHKLGFPIAHLTYPIDHAFIEGKNVYIISRNILLHTSEKEFLDEETVQDGDALKRRNSEARLSDAHEVYRICNSRPQRLLTSNGYSEKQQGRAAYRHRCSTLNNLHHDGRKRQETAPFCSSAPCDYYVVALRRILR